METKHLITMMKTSISDVLEMMFYLPLEISISSNWKESGVHEKDLLISKLDFKGSFNGSSFFFVPQTLALDLTSSFLGSDKSQITQEQILETVGEILNIMTGGTFSRYDDQTVFNLGIPEHVDLASVRIKEADSKDIAFVGIDTLDSVSAFQMVIED